MKKELISNKSMPIITTISIITRISVITTILIASIALTACTGKNISSETSSTQPPFQTTDQQPVAPLVGQPFTSPNPTAETIDTTDTSGTAAPSDTTAPSGISAPFDASNPSTDAGLYYGGCSWENQAMFDYEGYPRPSLMVFKYARG